MSTRGEGSTERVGWAVPMGMARDGRFGLEKERGDLLRGRGGGGEERCVALRFFVAGDLRNFEGE
jgi:hypothetical protein